MAAVSQQPLSRSPFQGDPHGYHQAPVRSIPILPSAAAESSRAEDAMDISRPAPVAPMGPPTYNNTSNEKPSEQQSQSQNEPDTVTNGGPSQPVGAAAAAQQPKVVQTAFIHKLYNMLEDRSIQHLISWASTNESFVMSPSTDFSKVLAQYFKHTNISSFVRQLNMYGFHKVSDVFHTGSPDSPLWEFKHGAGNFKRGDLAGLREIKRRASRHALIHRDSFPAGPPKITPQPPPGVPMEQMPDVETRLNILEWNQQDMYARLAHTEEAYRAMTSRCHALLDGLQKCSSWSQELSGHLLSLVPDPDNPVHRDVYSMRQDIARQMDHLRAESEPIDPHLANRQSFWQNSNIPMEPSLPMSPRQRPFDESRRPSLQPVSNRPNSFRAPVPPHLQISPRRYGSIGTSSAAYSPTSRAAPYSQAPAPPPPQQPQPHPLSQATSPPANLARRHTSADIRIHGWSANQPPPPPPPPPYGPQHQQSSPYASGQSSTAWPSSPQIRDQLAAYELPARRPPSPSSGPLHYANPNDAGWQIPGGSGGGGPRFGKQLDTQTPTRRSSMASNVHSLLNPADTAEREGEEQGEEGRKRKRVL